MTFFLGLLLGPLLVGLVALLTRGQRQRTRLHTDKKTQSSALGRGHTYQYDFEAELEIQRRQMEDLRRAHGKQFMDFCGSAYDESVRRGVNIWQVYGERAYDYYAKAQWDAWCFMWGLIGWQHRHGHGKTSQDPGDET